MSARNQELTPFRQDLPPIRGKTDDHLAGILDGINPAACVPDAEELFDELKDVLNSPEK